MTEAEKLVVREIEDAAAEEKRIPASAVKAWLRQKPSVEILGAIYVHVIGNSRRVEPPLSMEEICSTAQEYFRQCLIQNLQASEYAPNRSIAGLELVSWFHSLWRDPAVAREYLMRLKAMLEELCLKGEGLQDQMVGAVLEHLFEMPEIAEFFADWQSDPRLRKLFELAMEWARAHPPVPPVTPD